MATKANIRLDAKTTQRVLDALKKEPSATELEQTAVFDVLITSTYRCAHDAQPSWLECAHVTTATQARNLDPHDFDRMVQAQIAEQCHWNNFGSFVEHAVWGGGRFVEYLQIETVESLRHCKGDLEKVATVANARLIWVPLTCAV